MQQPGRINIFPDKVRQAGIKRQDKMKMAAPYNKADKNTSADTKRKIASIESELRSGEIQHTENVQAPQAGSRPTQPQHRLQQSLGINAQDSSMSSNANPLGDYSNLLDQDSDHHRQSLEVLRAMDLQTLNSKADVDRLLDTNASFMDHTSQYGLAQLERKAVAKLKKSGYSKLQSQTMY